MKWLRRFIWETAYYRQESESLCVNFRRKSDSLKAYDLEANEVYEIRKQENTPNVKQILKKNFKELSEGESFIQEFVDSIIIFKPAMLPGEEVGGFISVLWSKNQIQKLEWELLITALLTMFAVVVIGVC